MNALLSVSEAAKVCGVSRKTVQRHMRDGMLAWHGKVRRGPEARGIDVAELRKALSAPAAGGRIAARTRAKPVVDTVRVFLEECARDLAAGKLLDEANSAVLPKRVLAVFAAAAGNGADLDFMLFCVERLKERNQFFVLLVLGISLPPHFCEPLVEYAATWLRNLAEDAEIDVGRFSFIGWWRELAKCCVRSRVEVEPAIVTARAGNGSRTTLELVPRWLKEAPTGLLPTVGGHHSVATVRWTDAQKGVVNRATEKVAARLGDSEGSVQTARLAALLNLKSESFLTDSQRWQWICNAADGIEMTGDRSGRLVSEEVEAAMRRDYELLKGASVDLGINILEARELLRAWSRLSADLSVRATLAYDDALAAGEESAVKLSKRTVVANVFGVSRITLAKWLKDGGMVSPKNRSAAGKAQETGGLADADGDGDADGPEDADSAADGEDSGAEVIFRPEIEDLMYPDGRE